MTKILLVIIGMMSVGMYLEFKLFNDHYDGLLQQLDLIKKVCKVSLEP